VGAVGVVPAAVVALAAVEVEALAAAAARVRDRISTTRPSAMRSTTT
jgi:hypothetical protein